MIITRQELDLKTKEELNELFPANVAEFNVEIEMLEEEALKEKEQELIAMQDEYGKQLQDVVYELAKSCEFDGEKYSRARVIISIINSLKLAEVEWSYTLGLYELVKFWQQEGLTQVPYTVYDNTLRILNQIKYKGFQAWKDILLVNEYMSSMHERYVKDTSYIYYLAELHNAVINKLSPQENQESEIPSAE